MLGDKAAIMKYEPKIIDLGKEKIEWLKVTKEFVTGSLTGTQMTNIFMHSVKTKFGLEIGHIYESFGGIGDYKVLGIKKIKENKMKNDSELFVPTGKCSRYVRANGEK